MNDSSSSYDREATRAALLGPAVGGRRRSAPAPVEPASGLPAPFVSSRHGGVADDVRLPPADDATPAPREEIGGEDEAAAPAEAPVAPGWAEAPEPPAAPSRAPELAEARVQPPRPPQPPRPVEDWFDRFDLSPYQGAREVTLDEPAPPPAPLAPELSQAETLGNPTPPAEVQRSTEALEPGAPPAGHAAVLGRLAERLEEIARTLRSGRVPDPSGDPLEAWLAGYALGFLDASRADDAEG